MSTLERNNGSALRSRLSFTLPAFKRRRAQPLSGRRCIAAWRFEPKIGPKFDIA